eukprot:Rmarinus@m.17860
MAAVLTQRWFTSFPSIHNPASIPGKISRAWNARALDVFPQAHLASLFGLTLSDSEGVHIVDADGNKFLDMLTSASCNILGYTQPSVVEAYRKQATKLQQSCQAYNFNEPAIELAEKLIATFPQDAVSPISESLNVEFGMSGSDAMDGAIQCARTFTANHAVISFMHSYHGATGYSQPASGFHLAKHSYQSPNSLFRKHLFPSTQAEAEVAIERISWELATCKAKTVIVEPILGDGGVQIPPTGFFRKLRNVTREHGALLIVDEVQTGMGRTGKLWATMHEGIAPDLLVSAKSISGGFAPLSVLVGRASVMRSLSQAGHLFTYSGHAPSCAVSLQVFEILERENLCERSRITGQYFLQKLQTLQEEFPDLILNIRGKGLMIGVDFPHVQVPCKETGLTTSLIHLVAMRSLEKGVMFGIFGKNGCTLRIEPPLIITNEHVDQAVATLRHTLRELEEKLIPPASHRASALFGGAKSIFDSS